MSNFAAIIHFETTSLHGLPIAVEVCLVDVVARTACEHSYGLILRPRADGEYSVEKGAEAVHGIDLSTSLRGYNYGTAAQYISRYIEGSTGGVETFLGTYQQYGKEWAGVVGNEGGRTVLNDPKHSMINIREVLKHYLIKSGCGYDRIRYAANLRNMASVFGVPIKPQVYCLSDSSHPSRGMAKLGADLYCKLLEGIW